MGNPISRRPSAGGLGSVCVASDASLKIAINSIWASDVIIHSFTCHVPNDKQKQRLKLKTEINRRKDLSFQRWATSNSVQPAHSHVNDFLTPLVGKRSSTPKISLISKKPKNSSAYAILVTIMVSCAQNC